MPASCIVPRVHDIPLVTTIAAAFTAAWLLGLLTQRLRLSPIVGYLLAGIAIGPHTPGFTGDVHIAQQLSEVGVILLMFGVGLHFDLKDLLAVKRTAITGALGQSLAATVVSAAAFAVLGFPMGSGIVFGLALAVASTVVLIRMLDDRQALDTPEGHIAIGWLVVEDILTVVVLVLIPAFGGPGDPAASGWQIATTLGVALLKLGAFVAILMVVGARAIPWLLARVARLRSRELFTLTVLVVSIALAVGAYAAFGASMALGAFLAGMMVAQSPSSHQAAADALPLRDAFAVVFFVSVGMLFDPKSVVENPGTLFGALAVILVLKPLVAFALVMAFRHSSKTALTVAVGLAQIGEFSFILSDVGRRQGLMPEAGHNALVGAAIVAITLNPLLFAALPALDGWIRRRPRLWSALNRGARGAVRAGNIATIRAVAEPAMKQKPLAVVVGFGPVGQSVDHLLREAGLETVVVDLNLETVRELHARQRLAIFGDASRSLILGEAGVARASHVILTLPHAADRLAVVSAARTMNPTAKIVVRARYLSERAALEQAGASAAVFEEAEAALALVRLVLKDAGVSRDGIEHSIREVKLRLILENVANLGDRTVRSVMVPWSRVRRLSTSADFSQVLRQLAKERFSRWPVEDTDGRPIGYLLVKDLFGDGEPATPDDWTRLVRPLRTIGPDEALTSTLAEFQRTGTTVCLVEDAGHPIGLFTIEDILEQVIGRSVDLAAG